MKIESKTEKETLKDRLHVWSNTFKDALFLELNKGCLVVSFSSDKKTICSHSMEVNITDEIEFDKIGISKKIVQSVRHSIIRNMSSREIESYVFKCMKLEDVPIIEIVVDDITCDPVYKYAQKNPSPDILNFHRIKITVNYSLYVDC